MEKKSYTYRCLDCGTSWLTRYEIPVDDYCPVCDKEVSPFEQKRMDDIWNKSLPVMKYNELRKDILYIIHNTLENYNRPIALEIETDVRTFTGISLKDNNIIFDIKYKDGSTGTITEDIIYIEELLSVLYSIFQLLM